MMDLLSELFATNMALIGLDIHVDHQVVPGVRPFREPFVAVDAKVWLRVLLFLRFDLKFVQYLFYVLVTVFLVCHFSRCPLLLLMACIHENSRSQKMNSSTASGQLLRTLTIALNVGTGRHLLLRWLLSKVVGRRHLVVEYFRRCLIMISSF